MPIDTSLLETIRPGVKSVDGCNVLTHVQAFTLQQAVPAVLEFTCRDTRGVPVDLSAFTTGSDSSGASESIDDPNTHVRLRIKEWIEGRRSSRSNPVFTLDDAEIYNPSAGILHGIVRGDAISLPGIFRLEWQLLDAFGNAARVFNGLMFVEKSMAMDDADERYAKSGPPSISEIRMAMMDTRQQNTLLDDVEFSDAEILTAIAKPIQFWNECNPPIRVFYNTRDFPYRYHWLQGIVGHLHISAANHYRRNDVIKISGATVIADKRKEKEYMAEGQRLVAEFERFAITTKMGINVSNFSGSLSSSYARMGRARL